jgi:hypothetical protein
MSDTSPERHKENHMANTTDIKNPTALSDYDWLEFVSFAWKVDREGYAYAVENYGPEFEDTTLPQGGRDLKALYREHKEKVTQWWDTVGGDAACDLQNDHVDEARKRKEDARLWGIRCTDGFVITCDTQEYRDSQAADMRDNHREGWRMPQALLSRTVPGGDWAEDSRF